MFIAFHKELNKPDLLYKYHEFQYDIYIPIGVYNELKRPTFDTVKKYVDKKIIKLLDPIPRNEIKKLKDRHPNLKNGELEVILWGINFSTSGKKCYCVLDDDQARKVATKKEILFTGTKGLIKHMGKKGVINSKDAVLLIKELENSNFRIK